MISIKKVLKELAKPNRTLLWENDNPSADFAAKTISLDLSGYKFIEVIYGRATTSSYTKCEIGYTTVLTSFRNAGGYGGTISLNTRTIEATESSIVIGTCREKATTETSSGETHDSWNKPFKIYGIR